MAEKKISVSLEGRMDSLSRTLQQADTETERHTRAMASSFARVDDGIMSVGRSLGTLATGVAAYALWNVKEAAKQADAAATDLAITARYTGNEISAVNLAAKALTSDGLMTMTEASKGLQNLLGRGFSLEEAVSLMNGFKDSAAFGRQASLNFGEAVVTATEGLKNENSILVDNAGVTKNVSQMWKEYAAEHGTTADKLTQSQKRHAELNGILKETEGQLGNAARMAEGFAGAEAKSAKEASELKITLGTALQPAMQAVLTILTPVVGGLRDMVYWVETLGARAAATYDKLKLRAGIAFSGTGMFSKEGLAEYEAKSGQIQQNLDETISDIVKRSMGGTAPDIGNDTGKRRTDTPTAGPTAAERKSKQRELEQDRKEGMEVGKDMLDLFYKDQESRYRESLDTGSAMLDLFYKDLEARYKESAEYLNPLGQMTVEQQSRFDAGAMQKGWAARNSASDQSAREAVNRFAAEGDPNAQLALQLQQEEDYYIQHWAKMTDSEEVEQQRRTLIESFYSEKRKALLRQEEVAKLNSTMQYTNATANLFGSLYEVSGKKLKAFFYIQQTANAASAVMSGYKAGAAALEPPPIGLGPLAGGPLSTLMIAGGYASAAAIMAQTLMGPSAGGAGSASYGAGTPTSPIVTQPSFNQTQSQGNTTIIVQGNVMEDAYVENHLIPLINSAGTRQVRIEYIN